MYSGGYLINKQGWRRQSCLLGFEGMAIRQNRAQAACTGRGFTLIELVIALLVLAVAATGTMAYAVYAQRLASRSQSELTAARLGRLILDNWKKNGGDPTFDLTTLQMGFTKQPNSSVYKITINQLPMTVELTSTLLENDTQAMVSLRQIEAKIRWRSDRKDDVLRPSDPTYTIATYVRKDESGGG